MLKSKCKEVEKEKQSWKEMDYGCRRVVVGHFGQP